MYKEIFKNGIDDRSLDKAGKYALEKVMSSLRWKWSIREASQYFNSKVMVEPSVVYWPTKAKDYSGESPTNIFLADEACCWRDPNTPPISGDWKSTPIEVIENHTKRYTIGVDPYNSDDKESQGSL